MWRERFGFWAVVASAAVGLWSPPALANGRYPNADMLIVDPGDPQHLVLRATFGTLVSTDGGQSWRWVCEEAIGYVDMDPAMTVFSNGNMLHAFLGSIVVSSDASCSYGLLPFSADGRSAIDVTLDPVDTSRAWVLATGLEGRRQASLLRVGTDVEPPLVVAENFVPSTVEASKSRPERMYVVGFDASFTSTLMVSDDAGQTWLARPIAPYSARPMYLSAVDPGNPDVLYVRVDDGTSDHLLVSRDAGQSYADVLTIAADMLGFALSPDGSQVAAGGPGVPVQVASTSDLVFSPAANVASLRCLTWAERGLFACAQESLDGFTVALSSDGGRSFAPQWHVQDLVPLECAPSTQVGTVCQRAWLDIASQIGAELVPGEKPPAGEAAAKEKGCDFTAGRQKVGMTAVTACLAIFAGLALRRRFKRI